MDSEIPASLLKIAIQKGGRLSQDSERLLAQCGIRVNNGGSLRAEASNFPLEILYLRDDDIPQYVEEGVADIGIVGENIMLEKGCDVRIVERLGFGRCRMSLAVPRTEGKVSLDWFRGKRIATTYPGILGGFLRRSGIDASVETISGSVEIAPGIGLADAIFDIVSTGSTLLANGLVEVETVLRSEAVLIARKTLDPERERLLDQLTFRIKALRNAQRNKYILLNAPNGSIDRICSLLPGMKSPTILPLALEGWSSIHSVIPEDTFWEVIQQLKEAGAEGILVCPIENMIL
jgi:ATP phosphoribosyltransferase